MSVIVELGSYYPPHRGGIENNIKLCAEAFSESHKVSVVVSNTFRKMETEIADGIEIYRCPSYGKIWSQELTTKIVKTINSIGPDIIHYHHPNFICLYVALYYARYIPIMITHHLDITKQKFLTPLYFFAYKRLLKLAKGIMVYTENYARSSHELNGFLEKIEIVPHGIGEESLRIDHISTRELRKLSEQFGNRGFTVLYVGRLVRHKGLRKLISAIARLPEAQLLVAGEGPELRPCIKMAKDLRISSRVHFIGKVSESMKKALYRFSDAFVLPALTRAEAFGQVLVEAQLCRLPIVTTDIGTGTSEIALDGRAGFVVERGNVEELVGALKQLYSNKDKRQRMIELAYTNARRRYSREIVVPKLIKFLEKCLRIL